MTPTIVFADGFDWYPTSLQPRWDTGASIVPNSITAYGDGKSAGFGSGATLTKTITAADRHATMCVHFRIYLGSMDGPSNFTFASASNGTRVRIEFDGRDARRQIRVFQEYPTPDVLLYDSDVMGFSNNVWHHIQFAVTLHATLGSVELRIDNAIVYVGTSLNTLGGGDSVISSINFTYYGYLIDDLVLTSGVSSPLFLGDCRIVTRSPTGAGDSTQFAPTGSGTNWQNVDDVTVNLADYNSDGVIGEKDLYTIAPTGVDSSAVVYAVTILAYMWKSASAAKSGANLIKSAGSEHVGATNVLPDSADLFVDTWQLEPTGGVPWTIATAEAVQVGVKVIA